MMLLLCGVQSYLIFHGPLNVGNNGALSSSQRRVLPQAKVILLRISGMVYLTSLKKLIRTSRTSFLFVNPIVIYLFICLSTSCPY